jgi:hypothetical protein
MIIVSDVVNAVIDDYVDYLIREGITSQLRAYEKKNLMIQAIDNNLCGIVNHRPSPYKGIRKG